MTLDRTVFAATVEPVPSRTEQCGNCVRDFSSRYSRSAVGTFGYVAPQDRMPVSPAATSTIASSTRSRRGSTTRRLLHRPVEVGADPRLRGLDRLREPRPAREALMQDGGSEDRPEARIDPEDPPTPTAAAAGVNGMLGGALLEQAALEGIFPPRADDTDRQQAALGHGGLHGVRKFSRPQAHDCARGVGHGVCLL